MRWAAARSSISSMRSTSTRRCATATCKVGAKRSSNWTGSCSSRSPMDRTLQRESLLLTRFYAVAPEKVWRAWTEPEALRIWFGQADAADWKAQLDVRVGGRYQLMMREPSGHYFSVRGVYREVIACERLSFTWEQRDSPFDGDSLVTVAFEALDNG